MKGPVKPGRGNGGKSILLWVAIIFLFSAIYGAVEDYSSAGSRLTFTEFLERVGSDDIVYAQVKGNSITAKTAEGNRVTTLVPYQYPQLYDLLRERGVNIEVVPVESGFSTLTGIFISSIPILILIGAWIYMMRNMQGGGGKAMGFGKSRARMITKDKNNIRFADVAGIDEAKHELMEIVDYLRDPGKFRRLGGKIPRGCLLVGSPGTGKTLLAKAIAGEAGTPFFSISGSDFVEMFVGVGASRVRDMFAQAKKCAPCIIFIDEIDAVGRHRGVGIGGGNDEREQTLNQMLVEMDGFSDNDGVIVIAATNRPDVLDPALLRPGRFDRQITVPVPDINGREQILKVHAERVPLAPDVDLRVIARGTPGFAGADLANIVNEAALFAARHNHSLVHMSDLEEAKDKVMMGVERKSMVMRDEEKQLTAYHEGGHALVAYHLKDSDPIHKATIIPRGRALGMVMRLPEYDRFSESRAKMKADLAVAMGGRAAEELIFGYERVTSGAASDIQYVTQKSHMMVTRAGLSDEIGPIMIDPSSQERIISEDLANRVDSEVRKLVDEAHKLATSLLEKHRDQLELLAKALLEYETLTGDEIDRLLRGKPIREDSDKDATSSFDVAAEAPKPKRRARKSDKAKDADKPNKPARKKPGAEGDLGDGDPLQES
jgi:cell division protease FtsH